MLGAGWQVEATRGHVRDLPENTLGIEVEADFREVAGLLNVDERATEERNALKLLVRS